MSKNSNLALLSESLAEDIHLNSGGFLKPTAKYVKQKLREIQGNRGILIRKYTVKGDASYLDLCKRLGQSIAHESDPSVRGTTSYERRKDLSEAHLRDQGTKDLEEYNRESLIERGCSKRAATKKVRAQYKEDDRTPLTWELEAAFGEGEDGRDDAGMFCKLGAQLAQTAQITHAEARAARAKAEAKAAGAAHRMSQISRRRVREDNSSDDEDTPLIEKLKKRRIDSKPPANATQVLGALGPHQSHVAHDSPRPLAKGFFLDLILRAPGMQQSHVAHDSDLSGRAATSALDGPRRVAKEKCVVDLTPLVRKGSHLAHD